MKKVLFAASVYSHLAAFHKPFMTSFQEKGYEVHAVGSSSRGRKDELVEMGINCHDIEFDRLPFSQKNIKAIQKLDVLFQNHHFSLIHVHTPTAAFLTRYIAAKRKHGKVLYTAHGFHFFKGASRKNWLLFYPAEKMAKSWTDGLIVMNEEDYKLGLRMGFKDNQDLFFVHGVGVDLNEFRGNTEKNTDLHDELGIKSDAVIVSCIAELSARKNQMYLLENWNAIHSECPNAHLLLIGMGEDLSKIKSFIKDYSVEHVHLLGYRKDVPKIIAASDIVTLVSKHEGLPRCLMEAMACGKPIITTNVRGSRDLIDNGHCGVVVNLGDNESLIKGFVKLIQDEQLRMHYGNNGRLKIQEYSLANVLNEMESIYSRYLS